MARQSGDHLTVDADSLAQRVGQRLRVRRTELGRTLAEVASVADVSVSYLSSMETGANQASLPLLARVVHALDLTIADVLRSEGQNHVRTSRLEEGSDLEAQELAHEGLQLRIVACHAEPGDVGACPVPYDSRDILVVVRRGVLVVTVDGEDYELRAGDALDARTPRTVSWRVAGHGPVTALWAAGAVRHWPDGG